MIFEIKIKPLVLFDLEDKIKLQEMGATGKGRQLYQTFLAGLTELQHLNHYDEKPIYGTVRKYVAKDFSCSLFYMITENTILVMGLL